MKSFIIRKNPGTIAYFMNDIKILYRDQLYDKKRILALNNAQLVSPYLSEIRKFLISWWSPTDFILANTSGSTGKPKEIKLVKESMRASAEATAAYFNLSGVQGLKICNPLHVKFIAGKMMLVRAMMWNAEITILDPSSDPLKEVNTDYDFMVMTPHQLSVGMENGYGTNTAKIEKVLLGGSPVSPSLEHSIQSLRSKFYVGYGMTETMSHVAVRALNGEQKSMSYTAVPGISFSADERDCLVIHTDKLLPEPLITNDVVSLNNSTNFEWLGRYDHVINSGGIKLFPEKIEQKINSIIPVPFYLKAEKDEKLGEALAIVIESNEISETDKKLWISQMKFALDKYEMPRKWLFKDAFSRTETGKIKRL